MGFSLTRMTESVLCRIDPCRKLDNKVLLSVLLETNDELGQL